LTLSILEKYAELSLNGEKIEKEHDLLIDEVCKAVKIRHW